MGQILKVKLVYLALLRVKCPMIPFWYNQPGSLYSFHHWNRLCGKCRAITTVVDPLSDTEECTTVESSIHSEVTTNWVTLPLYTAVCLWLFFFCKGSKALFVVFFFLFQEECVSQTSPLREVFGQALECYSARACVHTLIYVNATCWWPSRLRKPPAYLFGKSSQYKHTEFVQRFGFLSVFQLISQATWSSMHFHVCLFWTYICEADLRKKKVFVLCKMFNNLI